MPYMNETIPPAISYLESQTQIVKLGKKLMHMAESTDRELAIKSTAILEKCFEIVVRRSLNTISSEEQNSMLRTTFTGWTIAATSLNLFPRHMVKSARFIAKSRNKFAHEPDMDSFEDKRMREICLEMEAHDPKKGHPMMDGEFFDLVDGVRQPRKILLESRGFVSLEFPEFEEQELRQARNLFIRAVQDCWWTLEK